MNNESKSEKFQRLAEKRTNEIINKIHLIGNLSNRRNYDYSEKQILEIFKAIDDELKKSKKKFDLNKDYGNNVFKFSTRDVDI